MPAGGIVAGVGKIHGVDTMVVANDGTVKGGTFYPITITKQLRLQVSASVSMMLGRTEPIHIFFLYLVIMGRY